MEWKGRFFFFLPLLFTDQKMAGVRKVVSIGLFFDAPIRTLQLFQHRPSFTSLIFLEAMRKRPHSGGH